MTTTLSQAISEGIRKAEAARSTLAIEVTDERIALVIARLASRGYIPSEQIVEPLRAYLQGYSLLLTGPAGVGKTFLMRCLGVKLWTAEFITGYGISDLWKWYDWTDEHDLCIDDLGAERTVSEYGAKDDVLKAVLSHRESEQTKHHRVTDIDPPRVGRTHITTNLSAEQIAERYGDRTLSRILGMCKPFKLTGESMRSPVPVMDGREQLARG